MTFKEGNLKLQLCHRSNCTACIMICMYVRYDYVECWSVRFAVLNWFSNLIFHLSKVFIPKVADSLLLSPTSSSAPLSPLSCLLSLWRWEVLTRAAHVRGERMEGGRRAYFRTQEWLACCSWVTGDGTPAWCIRTTHTETHTANTDRSIHISTQC